MCRLLAVTSVAPFAIADYVRPFAAIAKGSREYQGHGWGCAWQEAGAWRTHHSISPIWDDVAAGAEAGLPRTRVLVAHARSAFRDEGITVENNMPFVIPPLAFAFNGELQGVRIAAQGRIGAEKLFRFLVRVGAAEGVEALRRAVGLVEQRTRHVRAMNFVLGGEGRFLVSSSFSQDPEYFTLYTRRTSDTAAVCSGPLLDEPGWMPLANRTTEEIPWFS